MRLLSLELTGFRGFPREQFFDLDADAVVVVGANGNGKTSLFDGVLWALTGRIPRLSADDSALVSMYSETGEARAQLRLIKAESGNEVVITRSFDGIDTRISVQTSNSSYQGALAEAHLLDLIWRDATSAANSQSALAGVLTRGVYLQQDVIREFVEADSDEDRFRAVSELIGAGRVTELQASLERAKKAWSTATNQRQEELRSRSERTGVIDARLAELRMRPSQAVVTSELWAEWSANLVAAGFEPIRSETSSPEAPNAIDSAIKHLNASKRTLERRLELLATLQADVSEVSEKPVINLDTLADTIARHTKDLEDLRNSVVEEQERLSLMRSQQAILREKSEQLKTLAMLALENLGEHCPVCNQTYNREDTERRLRDLTTGFAEENANSVDGSVLTALLEKVNLKENELAAAELALRMSQRSVREFELRRQGLSTRLDELGIEVLQGNIHTAVSSEIDKTRDKISRFVELQETGETMAARLAHSSALALIQELENEAEVLRREVAELERNLAARNRTGDLAQKIIEGLREASSSVVQQRLNEISPLLQSIYSRVDAHPSFRVVRFLSQVIRGKGHLSTIVCDPLEAKESSLPSAVLSSSQLNALAVAVFLALNIGVPQPPLSVAMLDDPLQSLDDINLLGLVDLLRRTKARRQLLVSTHDRRFGNLLSRKLRPRNGERTTVIELEGWSRRGPTVKTHEVRSDPVQWRLIAS